MIWKILGSAAVLTVLLALLKDAIKGAILKLADWVLGIVKRSSHVPKIEVVPHLDGQPFFTYLTDITRVVFTLTNAGTMKTKILEGYVRISNPDKAAHEDKREIPKTHLTEGEHKKFFAMFKPMFHQAVMSGEAILKAECNLTLERPNGRPHEQSNRYTYNVSKKRFEEDHS
jgi:hypothetical protein